MAQQGNTYRATVYLKSQLAIGNLRGDENIVLASSPAGALAILQSVYGSDVAYISAPTMAAQGVWTNLAGTITMGADAVDVPHDVHSDAPPEKPTRHGHLDDMPRHHSSSSRR